MRCRAAFGIIKRQHTHFAVIARRFRIFFISLTLHSESRAFAQRLGRYKETR